jgi:hypothetical protein
VIECRLEIRGGWGQRGDVLARPVPARRCFVSKILAGCSQHRCRRLQRRLRVGRLAIASDLKSMCRSAAAVFVLATAGRWRAARVTRRWAERQHHRQRFAAVVVRTAALHRRDARQRLGTIVIASEAADGAERWDRFPAIIVGTHHAGGMQTNPRPEMPAARLVGLGNLAKHPNAEGANEQKSRGERRTSGRQSHKDS